MPNTTPEPERRGSLSETVWLAAGSGASFVLGLIRTKVQALAWGPIGLGSVGLMQASMSTASLIAGGGADGLITRELAAAGADKARINAAAFQGVPLIAALGATLSCLIFALFSERLGFTSVLDAALVSTGVAFTVSGAAWRALLAGHRQSIRLAATQVFAAVGATAFVGVLAFWSATPVVLALAAIALPLAQLFAVAGPALVLAKGNLRSLAESVRLAAGYYRLAGALAVAGVLPVFAQLLVRAEANQLLNDKVAFGAFQASLSLAAVTVSVLASSIGPAVLPRLTAVATDPPAFQRTLVSLIDDYLVLYAPVAILLAALPDLAIRLLFSSQFEAVTTQLPWQLVGEVFRLPCWVMATALTAQGRFRAYLLVESVSLVATVALVALAAPLHSGPLLGGALSLATVVQFAVLAFLLRKTDVSLSLPLFGRLGVVAAGVLVGAAGMTFWAPLRVVGVGCGVVAAGFALKRLSPLFLKRFESLSPSAGTNWSRNVSELMKRVLRWWGLPVLFAAVIHFPSLLVDGIYGDDWFIYLRQFDHHLEYLETLFREMGTPGFYYLHRVLLALHAPFAYRATFFVCVLVSVALVRWILLRARVLSEELAWFAALLFAAYPGTWAGGYALITVPYVLLLTMFFGALALLLWAEDVTGLRRLVAIALGCVLMLVSFTLKSLLVFEVLLPVLLVFRLSDGNWAPMAIFKKLGLRWAYLVLPLVSWVGTKVLFPTHGAQAAYNAIQFNFGPSAFPTGMALWFVVALYDYFDVAARYVLQVPVALIACGLLIWSNARKQTDETTAWMPGATPGRLALVGFALLLAAAFPYAAVSKSPNAESWEARHTLLSGLPFVVLVVGGLGQLIGARAVRVLVPALAVMWGVWTVHHYAESEADWARDLGTLKAVKAIPDVRKSSIIWLHDRAGVGNPTHFALTVQWASMMRWTLDEPNHLVFDDRHYRRGEIEWARERETTFTEYYALANANPEGCELDLELVPGREIMTSHQIASRMWLYKLIWPARVDQLLARILEVKAGPLQCRAAPVVEPAPAP